MIVVEDCCFNILEALTLKRCGINLLRGHLSTGNIEDANSLNTSYRNLIVKFCDIPFYKSMWLVAEMEAVYCYLIKYI